MEALPPVSVVIPTLNEEAYLPKLLESLLRTGAPMEVIVVDGNSTDRTVEIAQSFVSRFSGNSSLTVLRATSRGVSQQRNLGARDARHEILVFLDSDTEMPSPEAYRKMLSRFVAKGYVVAGPLLKATEGDFGANFIYANGLLFQLTMLLFGKLYMPGTCVFVRRGTFVAVGGFDTNLRLAEDVDFSIRAADTGPHGILPTFINVSSRRFRKYGYVRIYATWASGILLVMFGRVQHAQKIQYPFGEFTGEAKVE